MAQKGMNDPQMTGSASSYALKYALCALFAIDDGNDADKQQAQSPAQPAMEIRMITSEQIDEISSLMVKAQFDEIKAEKAVRWASGNTCAGMADLSFAQAEKLKTFVESKCQ